MQSAAQKNKIEEEIIISDENVRFINEQPINDLVNSDQSDDENWNIEIPKSFRQKAFVHKTITKKQSKILTERCSNMLHKGKVWFLLETYSKCFSCEQDLKFKLFF